MSDERLRDLERRWKETGSVEDEAAWITERMRVGMLAQDRVELAAYCGHQAARKALGRDACETPEDLEEWIRGLPAQQSVACAVALRLSEGPKARICTTSHLAVLRYALSNGADPKAVRSAARLVLIHRALGRSDPFSDLKAWLALGLPDPGTQASESGQLQASETAE